MSPLPNFTKILPLEAPQIYADGWTDVLFATMQARLFTAHHRAVLTLQELTNSKIRCCWKFGYSRRLCCGEGWAWRYWWIKCYKRTKFRVHKRNGQPRTGHEGPWGEQRYSSTLSLTSALDGVGGQHHAPATLPWEREPIPIVQEAGWASGPLWTGTENLAPPGFDPWTVQPIASGYTDWAILVLKVKCLNKFNTLRMGDANLRFYITTAQDGWRKSAFLTRACFPCTIHLTFRHRASCIFGQAFNYSPDNAFYIFNQQIYFIIWYLLDRASLI
jgi:hypothetical protein